MKTEVKSILNVLLANSLILLIGIVQTFILPSLLSPEEYGYWSLYLLYTGYAGFLIFGFCDGFYLKYGGEKYEKLDKREFSSYHWMLFSYLLILFIGWVILISSNELSNKRYLVFLMVGIGIVLADQVSYFVLLNQATARFSIYAKGHVIEKVVILVIAISGLFLPEINAFYIIGASVFGKLLTVIYFSYFSKDIIFAKPLFNKNIVVSAIDNIKVGFILTLSGVGSMLMTGFGRFVVERKLGIVELGYYSLMFSVSALFTQLIYAISTVLFPLFRRIKEQRAKILLERLDRLIIDLSGLVLLLYYPIRFFLEIIFPKYQPAMAPMVFLFPIIISQARMTLVYNTLYKVLRYEKRLMRNVITSLSFCIVTTVVLFRVSESKEAIAFATLLGFLFWNFIAKLYYQRKEGSKIDWITHDIALSGIYLVANIIWGFSITSLLITTIAVLVMIIIKRKEVISIIKEFKKSIR